MALRITKTRLGIAAAVMAAAVTTAVFLSPSSDPKDVVLGPQASIGNSWYDTTEVERGRFHGRNFPATPPTGAELDAYTNLNYYDLGLALAILYKRTGDPEFLTLYRKVADSWWQTPNWIEEGRVRNFDVQGPSPRNASLGGLILRALDGRPEMWDWLNAYTRYHFNVWLKIRINDPQLYLGVRDGAYMLKYAAILAQVLPDSFPLTAGGTATNGAELRAQYLADIEAVTFHYFGRLQYPDGSWRWDDPYATDADGGQLVGIMQPFMIGLLMDALIEVYDATSNETVKASIVNQVTKACRHLYSGGPYSTQHLSTLNVNLRGFHYTYHGGTTKNPTKYEKGDLPPDWNPTNPSDVQNQRQPIGLIVAAYGWSYQRTGDPYFKAAGDDLWDSAYGETDGVRNYMAGDAKSYNQNCRWAGLYLVWREGGTTPEPSPSPVPTTPVPKTPSPDGTKGSTIVDKNGGVWTFGKDGETLRDDEWMGRGKGFANNSSGTVAFGPYKYYQTNVYVLGTDSNWYVWIASWNMVGSEPGVVTPTPQPEPPKPVPQPVPEEYRIEAIMPKDNEANRTKLYQRMFGLGFAAYEEVSGPNVKFRRFK